MISEELLIGIVFTKQNRSLFDRDPFSQPPNSIRVFAVFYQNQDFNFYQFKVKRKRTSQGFEFQPLGLLDHTLRFYFTTYYFEKLSKECTKPLESTPPSNYPVIMSTYLDEDFPDFPCDLFHVDECNSLSEVNHYFTLDQYKQNIAKNKFSIMTMIYTKF